MKILTSIFESVSKVAARVAFLAVVLLADTFFIRAQESSMRIYYRFDNAVVDTAYLSNPEAFSAINSAIENGRSEAIEIVSFSSPEGNFNYNLGLSTRRANALRKYLVARHPELSGKVSINPSAESWEALRASVESDSRLSESAKDAMLQIIDSNDSADVKERKLAALQSYRYLYSNYFKTLRFAEVRFAKSSVAVNNATASASATDSSKAAEAGAAAAKAVAANNSNNLIFALRSSTIESGAHNNAAVLASIAGMISGRNVDEIANINILSTASPEGPEAINNSYSLKRGQALRDYIIAEYPALAGKITVHSAGEAWEDLRAAVDSDTSLSDASRTKLLSIIVSTASPDAKEAKLRALPEWKHLFEEVFPGLRYARVTVDYNEAPAEPAEPIAEPAEITVPTIADEPAIEVEDETVEATDTLKVQDEKVTVAPVAPVLPSVYPLFAVSTNVVYDLAGVADGFRFTPNFSVELPIGNKWSTFAEYTFPWWLTSANDQAWQILKWDIGARRWLSRHNANDPMDILSGHFLGIDLGAGYYDIEPKHKGWQGEFQTVGLEYGYAWKLGRAWRLDAYVGAGWMGTHYRYYAGDSTDQHLIYQHHGKLTWFGPTKAGVSVKYIFNTTNRRNVK